MTVENMRQRDKFSQKHSKKKKSKILSAGEITELASKALIPGISSSSSHMVLNLKWFLQYSPRKDHTQQAGWVL